MARKAVRFDHAPSYKDFTNPAEPRVPKPKGDTVSRHCRWWNEDGDRVALSVSRCLEEWNVYDSRRENEYLRYADLYGKGLSFFGLGSGRTKRSVSRAKIVSGRAATWNGVQSGIDSATAQVGANRTRPRFLASGGDYKAHKLAASRNRWIGGLFYQRKTYDLGRQAFRDSGIWGDGIVHVFAHGMTPHHERVYPGELHVNDSEAEITGTSRTMIRTRRMDREDAIGLFRDGQGKVDKRIAEAIRKAPNVPDEEYGAATDTSDLIELHEAWRLPSFCPDIPSNEQTDGRHVICTVNATLWDQPWRWNCFPFAKVQCISRPFGFWSQGFAEVLENMQLDYNTLSTSVNAALRLGGRFKLWCKTGSNIVIEHINNEIGAILRSDDPPQSLLWQLVQPEVYQRMETLKTQMREQVGTNQMQANGTKPAGLNAAVALREYNDIGTQRLAIWGQSYEEMYLQIARLSVMVQQDIMDRYPNARFELKVQKPNGTCDTIDYRDIEFKPGEEFTVTCYPTAELPDTPEGRLELAQEYVQAGWYDQDTAREVFSNGDTARVESVYNATMELFERITDEIIEHGTQPDVDALDNNVLGLRLAEKKYAYAKVREVSQEHLDVFARYILELQASIAANQPKPPAPPPANPEPTPTSPLIPNVNQPQPSMAA